MNKSFSIYSIAADAAQAEEAMGTKFKFWTRHPALGNCLFKVARPGTGEDWSEKAAAKLCMALDLPHASYELANWQNSYGIDVPGTLSPQFLQAKTALLHGNDILSGMMSNYPKDQEYGLSQHTLDNVFAALALYDLRLPIGCSAPAGVTTPADVFIGYLLLDAWIGNGDRHHENWGFVVQLANGSLHLAPTYDHASCLGRELQDSKREARLNQKTIAQYASKSRSAFYQQESDRKAILTFDAFVIAARRNPLAALSWLNRLENISLSAIEDILKRLPKERLSTAAYDFAVQMLEINQARLLSLRKDLL